MSDSILQIICMATIKIIPSIPIYRQGDFIDGGTGIDTVVYSELKANFTWAKFVVDPTPDSGIEPWEGWSFNQDSLKKHRKN